MTRKQIFLVIFCVNSSTVVTIRGMKATEEGKPASVKVSFKVKKTGKASKYSYTSKVVVTAEQKEPTPEVATKISSVTATAADTIEVKFDAPVADATKEVKLDRAGVSVETTAKWSDAKDSVILTGKTAFAAGTYTVTYDEFTGSCIVSARKATSIEVLTTKVGLGTNLGTDQKVYFNVLDQYGKAMNYSSNRMTITATNLTKGLNMSPSKNSTTTNPYFTLSTNAASMSIGNDIAVVIALTSDPTVIKTANLTIDNIYTESFEFGEVELAGDAHAYVNQGSKYSLNYTAVDTEGKAVLLSKANSLGTTATVNNITFVSSNTNTINPASMKIDASGKLYFTTGSYASKVTLTAVNNVTGKTSTIDIQVGDSSKATKLEIADITVAKKDYASTTTIGKADVVVYDQYGDMMKAADVAKLDLSTSLFNVISGLGSVTASISDDGKYLVYKAGGSGFNASTSTLGVTYNVNFVSNTDATVTSVGKITIGEDSALASIQEVAAPDAVVVEGKKIKIKVKVLDNYDAAQTITGTTTKGAITGKGYLTFDDPGSIIDTTTSISNTANDVSTVELQTKTITEAFKSGTVRLVLINNDGEEVDSKSYNVTISGDANAYDVTTDKDVYNIGDTVKVTVKALEGSTFLSKYKATVPVNITVGAKKYNKDLSFENGVATVEVPAIANATSVVVAAADSSATGTKSGLTITTAADPAYFSIAPSANTTITATLNDGSSTATTYTGYKTATIKVTNAAGMDVTGDFCTAAGFASGAVDADGNLTLNFAAGVATLTSVNLGTVSAGGNITAGNYVVTITVGSVSGKITATAS